MVLSQNNQILAICFFVFSINLPLTHLLWTASAGWHELTVRKRNVGCWRHACGSMPLCACRGDVAVSCSLRC
jgi:hypothetical protein